MDDIRSKKDLIQQIIKSTNEQVEIQHPEHLGVNIVYGIMLSDRPCNPKATVKNISITIGGLMDRSPCGTGTCARMAIQYAKGELGLGETFVTESIIGSLFHGKLIKEVKVGSFKAVLPEVTGRAWITGMHNFVTSEDDPFKYGFKL